MNMGVFPYWNDMCALRDCVLFNTNGGVECGNLTSHSHCTSNKFSEQLGVNLTCTAYHHAGYTSSGGDPVAPPGSIVAFAVNETPGHPVLSLLAHAPALGTSCQQFLYIDVASQGRLQIRRLEFHRFKR